MTATAKSWQRAFMTRTYNIYRHQGERAAAAGKALDYSLEKLRGLVGLYLDKWGCAYCEAQLTPANVSVDHAEPVKRGGPWDFDNLRVCCEACNQAKGTLTAEEYRSLLVWLTHVPPGEAKVFIARLRAGGRVIRS